MKIKEVRDLDKQAIKEKMPAKYRRQITLYYQNLAETKGE